MACEDKDNARKLGPEGRIYCSTAGYGGTSELTKIKQRRKKPEQTISDQKPTFNSETMNTIFKLMAPRAFAVLLALSFTGLAACSTGTKPGDTNVEEGSSKDKNPAKRDEPGQNTSQTDARQDTSEAYKRSMKTPHTDAPGHEGHGH